MAAKSVSTSPAATHKRQLTPILLLLLYVFLSLMECMDASNSVQSLNGFRVNLVHIDSLLPANTTSTERMKRAVQRSKERLEKLQYSMYSADKLQDDAQMKDIQSPVSRGNGEYLMEIAIGTPALSFSAVLDSGSDLVWTKCNPCTDCSTSVYDPSSSSTYSKLPCQSSLCQDLPQSSCDSDGDCQYLYRYGDKSNTQGILSSETFSLSSESVPQIAFGCAHDIQGFEEVGGLIGFGRGPLSLVSQLAPSVGNKFSYCLVSRNDSSSQTSPLFIGNTATLNAPDVSSTPYILQGGRGTYYYLSLQGISVSGQSLDIPAGTFDIRSDGSGGVIIDSGTTLTFLAQSAYDAVKTAMNSSINLPQVGDTYGVGLDLCFDQSGSSNPSFPAMTFHFKGADYDVPKENYLFPDTTSDVVCLAMLPTSSGLGYLSIIGNVQQQNYQILYDNEKSVLSFAPTVCDTL